MSIQYRKENSMKYFREHEWVKPEIYYHYTSTSALFHIIKTKSFWLTNLTSSNDKKELSYSFSSYLEDFDSIIKMESDRDKCERLMKIRSVNFSSKFPRLIGKNDEPYALCLCLANDNLTHWDRYTEKCSGVSVAINISAYKILALRKHAIPFGLSLLAFNPISYLQKDRIQAIKNYLDSISIVYEKNGLSNVASSPLLLVAAYLNVKNFIKLEAFHDEDEFRVYYNPSATPFAINLMEKSNAASADGSEENLLSLYQAFINELDIEEKRYGLFGGKIRSYHNLCLREIWGDGLIPEIMLGPMCTQDKRELREFLNDYGLKGTKITESKVPIR